MAKPRQRRSKRTKGLSRLAKAITAELKSHAREQASEGRREAAIAFAQSPAGIAHRKAMDELDAQHQRRKQRNIAEWKRQQRLT